ncbi:hypothetical protein [Streptomyces aidingensis]|uniref:Uncharacterized protein n=1 Tax=Streptomyces aidingensis TaxID=910347 RepID=A0A1I1J8U9_9ACTN|nr:hypothetical protein [Streptomyces aidingensis]SFC44876.1 hypothetical protein SAMN05421773_103323 [Streptomyces aidingensis]
MHDWRASLVTSDLDAGENPAEIAAEVRHHAPGYTISRYGKRREESARKPAASTPSRMGPDTVG